MEWTPAIGEVIAGNESEYEILAHIDTGGFSEVFKAQEVNTGKTVAIKTPNFDSRSLHLDRFVEREVRGLRTMAVLGGHDSAMSLREHIVIKGTDLLVVEFVDGDLLTSLETPLNSDTVRNLGIELASVLGTLHRNDMVYRDLKADNAFVVGNALVLVDFNTIRPISRCFECGTFVHSDAAGENTCIDCESDIGPFVCLSDGARGNFKAPEQREHTKASGPWVDVFAAGKLLHYLLTGFAPPEPNASPDTQSYDVPAYLGDIIARATAAEPADRYRDGTHLGRALTERTVDPGPPTASLIDLTTDTVHSVRSGAVLGRPTTASTPDITLSGESAYTSREHLRFEFERHQWVLYDESRNGVEIGFDGDWYQTGSSGDSDRITARRQLQDGCTIVPVDRTVGRRYRFQARPIE